MTKLVLSEDKDRVATLTLNRPDQGNSWSGDIEEEFRKKLLLAQADPKVRAIVVTGAGRTFCVGRSVDDLNSANKGGVRFEPKNYGDGDLEQRLTYIAGINKPVIAAINGGMAGMGFVLSLYCDMRFMAEGANLSTAFSRRGLAAEEGSAWMLSRLIGRMNATDLLLSARKVSAAEAEKLGLVRCLPREGFLQAVQSYAADIANYCSPRSIQLIKAQLWDADSQGLAGATREAQSLVRTCQDHEDFAEGTAHFIEKRRPNFKDLSD